MDVFLNISYRESHFQDSKEVNYLSSKWRLSSGVGLNLHLIY